MPKRIQRKRAAGWKMPDGAVYVGRPTKWGNPYRIGDDARLRTAQDVVDRYENFIHQDEELYNAAKEELRGKDLACWCPLDQPCHGDVLLRIAND